MSCRHALPIIHSSSSFIVQAETRAVERKTGMLEGSFPSQHRPILYSLKTKVWSKSRLVDVLIDKFFLLQHSVFHDLINVDILCNCVIHVCQCVNNRSESWSQRWI